MTTPMPETPHDSTWIRFLRLLRTTGLLFVILAASKDRLGLGLTTPARNALFLVGAGLLIVLVPTLLVRDEWVATLRGERTPAWWKWLFVGFGALFVVLGPLGADEGDEVGARVFGAALLATGGLGFALPRWFQHIQKRSAPDDDGAAWPDRQGGESGSDPFDPRTRVPPDDSNT